MMKTSKNRFLGAVLTAATLLTTTIITRAAEEAPQYTAYRKAAKAIVESAINKKVDVAEVEKNVKQCVVAATWAALEYAKAFPTGAKLLKAVVDNVPVIEKLEFKEIESEWHDLKHFKKPGNDPGVDVSAEENEHFTDPIHAIVHPFLVLKAAQAYAKDKKDEDLKAVKDEMEEGLEQMEKMEKKLADKK